MSILHRLLRRPSTQDGDYADSRRQFLRRAGGLGALAAGLALSDEAWAGIEARADRYGIKPGTVVGPDGRPLNRAPLPAEPFVGEIGIFGFNFAPRGWAFCNGELQSIATYSALFSLLGTFYGGDGRTTFALPDLRGRFPMHFGNGPGLAQRPIGQRGGSEQVTLTTLSMPAHNHGFTVSTFTSPTDPENFIVVRDGDDRSEGARNLEMANTGGGQAHDNMPPFLVVNFCIALQGLFPSRN